ncbi:MAG TPA: sigma factor-like helix-turn-helix DNA-binding protein [Streptosporangiaceae bacterium]|nr:sigma factor-like helix-turn-helix DNA-binding protein [Streptosporangiaceae bacterium]
MNIQNSVAALVTGVNRRMGRHLAVEFVSREAPGVADQTREKTAGDCAQQFADPQRVLAAIRTLSIEHRQVLVECYYRGASVAKAAETLGVPPATVKSRAYYAVHALRRALEEIGSIA